VDLDEREIDDWCEVDKVEATADSFLIYVAIPLVWLNAPRRDDWEWREAGYNADQSLAYYTCRGLAVSRDLINTVANGIEVSGLYRRPPGMRWREKSAWTLPSGNIGLRNSAIPLPRMVCRSGSVSLTSGSARLLQGGSWWDVGVVNWGGTFGKSYPLSAHGRKRKFTVTISKSLKRALETTEARFGV
jgi:hypothetical protein